MNSSKSSSAHRLSRYALTLAICASIWLSAAPGRATLCIVGTPTVEEAVLSAEAVFLGRIEFRVSRRLMVTPLEVWKGDLETTVQIETSSRRYKAGHFYVFYAWQTEHPTAGASYRTSECGRGAGPIPNDRLASHPEIEALDLWALRNPALASRTFRGADQPLFISQPRFVYEEDDLVITYQHQHGEPPWPTVRAFGDGSIEFENIPGSRNPVGMLGLPAERVADVLHVLAATGVLWFDPEKLRERLEQVEPQTSSPEREPSGSPPITFLEVRLRGYDSGDGSVQPVHQRIRWEDFEGDMARFPEDAALQAFEAGLRKVRRLVGW